MDIRVLSLASVRLTARIGTRHQLLPENTSAFLAAGGRFLRKAREVPSFSPGLRCGFAAWHAEALNKVNKNNG
jgi:hypothetical protein